MPNHLLGPTPEEVQLWLRFPASSAQGAGTFTVFLNGWLFVNKGAASTGGIGFLGC